MSRSSPSPTNKLSWITGDRLSSTDTASSPSPPSILKRPTDPLSHLLTAMTLVNFSPATTSSPSSPTSPIVEPEISPFPEWKDHPSHDGLPSPLNQALLKIVFSTTSSPLQILTSTRPSSAATTASLTSGSASADSPVRKESPSGCKPPQTSENGMTSPIQSTSSSELWTLTEPKSSSFASAKARRPANTATSESRSRKPNNPFCTQPIQTIASFIGAMVCCVFRTPKT